MIVFLLSRIALYKYVMLCYVMLLLLEQYKSLFNGYTQWLSNEAAKIKKKHMCTIDYGVALLTNTTIKFTTYALLLN